MGDSLLTTKTGLLNYALSQLGEGRRITDFDNDKSAEAETGRDTFAGLRDEKIQEFKWRRFQKQAALGQVGPSPYNDDWAYAYRFPSDALQFHRILNGDRDGLTLRPVAFLISNDKTGLLILTDQAGASGEWTLSDPPLNLWSAYFRTAFAYEWAAVMAPRLLKQSGFKMQDRLMALAAKKWMRAKALDGRDQKMNPKPPSRITRARGGVNVPNRSSDAPADN